MVSESVYITIEQIDKFEMQKLEIVAEQGSLSASFISLLKHWKIKI